jgi:hypothetical protein
MLKNILVDRDFQLRLSTPKDLNIIYKYDNNTVPLNIRN